MFQFLVWEVLSTHTLPARRDLAWQALRKIPALTPDAVYRAAPKALLDAVGLTGSHREDKVERIRAMVGEFKRHRQELDSEVMPQAGLLRSARVLRRLAQFDDSTRARALLFAASHLVLPIDSEVARVVTRFSGESNERSRPAAKRWLRARLPKTLNDYRNAVLYLRHHAQHTCIVVGPHCTVCPLRCDCAFARRSGLVQRGDPSP